MVSDEHIFHHEEDAIGMDDENEDVVSFENFDKDIIYSKNNNKTETLIEADH